MGLTRIVVFTAQMGDRTDPVRAPLVIDPRARYVCFSDRPVHVPPYEWIPVPVSSTPRLTSRSYKILADHPALEGAPLTLWHDASYQLVRDVRWVAERLRNGFDLVAFQHAKRKRTLEREAHRLVKYGYLSAAAAAAHVLRYRTNGFSSTGPVTCGGLLGRRQSARLMAFNRHWWSEAQQWGGRDQASLDYVAWREGITIGHLDGQIKANAYAQWRETAVAA